MNTKIEADPLHEEFYQRMALIMQSEPFASMEAIELLAVAANFMGKLAAYQDQRKYTPDQVMALIVKNFELGNQQVVAETLSAGGTAN